MRIKDYFGAVGSKPLVFGLAWDVTDGVSIDLDASAIMLSGDMAGRQLVDVRCLRPSLLPDIPPQRPDLTLPPTLAHHPSSAPPPSPHSLRTTRALHPTLSVLSYYVVRAYCYSPPALLVPPVGDGAGGPRLVEICIVRLRHLPKMDRFGTCDPYVKMHTVQQGVDAMPQLGCWNAQSGVTQSR